MTWRATSSRPYPSMRRNSPFEAISEPTSNRRTRSGSSAAAIAGCFSNAD